MNEILDVLPEQIRNVFWELDFTKIEEIRLRVGKRITLESLTGRRVINHIVTTSDLALTIELMTQSSLYAFLEQIREGFIIIKGGHRIGLCGRAVVENGNIINLTEISGINIRIAKEIKNIARKIAFDNNVLLIAPPNCGKTTLLRDIVRRASRSKKVSLIDERGEIAASFVGVPQFDVGENTDVLSLCKKSKGIDMILRSMSPEIIAVDEIATAEDIDAVIKASNCGVNVIATVHGKCIEDVESRLDIKIFDSIYILKREGGKFTYDKTDWCDGNNARLFADGNAV